MKFPNPQLKKPNNIVVRPNTNGCATLKLGIEGIAEKSITYKVVHTYYLLVKKGTRDEIVHTAALNLFKQKNTVKGLKNAVA